MGGPRPITPEERAELERLGWRPWVDEGRETGWWFPPSPYVGPAFSGREAVREVRRGASLRKGEGRG